MKTLYFLFAAGLILLPQFSKAQSIGRALFVGDSHSDGAFGTMMDTYLRSLAGDVTSVASCGSSPSTWMTSSANYKSTNCGYWRKDSKGSETRVNSHQITPFKDELANEKPDLTVIALGTNVLASPANITQEKIYIEQMLTEVRKSGSRCVWVGPPDARKEPFKTNLKQGVKEIRTLVEQHHCFFVDSSLITVYPAKGGDGIHFDAKSAAAWGKNVTGQITKDLSEQSVPSRASSPTQSASPTAGAN